MIPEVGESLPSCHPMKLSENFLKTVNKKGKKNGTVLAI